MRFLRKWLQDALDTEVVPYQFLKFFFLIPSSLVGGWMFARSGSWLVAIQWDFWAYLCCWALVKPGEWIGEMVTRALLWLLPLYSVE